MWWTSATLDEMIPAHIAQLTSTAPATANMLLNVTVGTIVVAPPVRARDHRGAAGRIPTQSFRNRNRPRR